MTEIILSIIILVLVAGCFVAARQLLAARTEATRLTAEKAMLFEHATKLEQEKGELTKLAEQEKNARVHAEKQLALAQQETETAYKFVKESERNKEEALKNAQAAMFESGQAAFGKQAEEWYKKADEQFKNIRESFAVVDEAVKRERERLGTLWQALASPSAAGQFSEFSMENALKSFGLTPGRDFITQFSVKSSDNAELRPDAVVFLPGNNVLVIDSKASKFFLDIAQSANQETEQQLVQKLTRRMNDHLKSLASKNYHNAVLEYCRQAGKAEGYSHACTVMYLQTELNVEKLCTADPDFRERCARERVIPSGPTGLAALLDIARHNLALASQEENHRRIMSEVGNLLGNIEVVAKHAASAQKALESTAKHFSSFTSSLNTRLLSTARKVTQMGVPLPTGKQLPDKLSTFQIVADSAPLIEGEAEEATKKLTIV